MPELNRFHEAQRRSAGGYKQAKRELSAGKKTGHWIWYILPQLQVLGYSVNAQYYGIVNFQEACDYLCDETLFKHYYELIKIIESKLQSNPNLGQLMGADDVKLVSSLTLFREAASILASQEGIPSHNFKDLKDRCDNIFTMTSKQPCIQTLSFLESQIRHKSKSSTSIPVEHQVSIKTTHEEPPVVRRKTTLFEPPVVPIQTTPKESPVTHATRTLDEPPVPITPMEGMTSPEAVSPLVPQLEAYIDMRRNEWSFHYNFLGIVSFIYFIMDSITGTDHFHEKSRDVKINAATKLKQILDSTAPEPSTQLSHAEMAALKEGRLGELVAQHGNLEQLIQNAPQKQIMEDSSHLPFSF